MGFKQRERKRKAKAATKMAQARSRATGSSAGKHWLTVVGQKAACNECAGILRIGADCVSRQAPREILCVRCAGDRHLFYRPSVAWEKSSRAKRSA